jgi:RNA-directed DNA polymerase
MSGKRQNIQLRLAFGEETRSEAPQAPGEGSETLTAKCMIESPAKNQEQLMEEVCERENCLQAYKRVKSNKGSAGIDGMTVDDLSAYLKEHWPAIREQLLSGTYKPQPVKRVEIPKPDGGVRQLGIPTVLDRMVQQAVMQVLQRSMNRRVRWLDRQTASSSASALQGHTGRSGASPSRLWCASSEKCGNLRDGNGALASSR